MTGPRYRPRTPRSGSVTPGRGGQRTSSPARPGSPGSPGKPDGPRKVRNGLKLKTDESALREHPVAGAWLAAIEAAADPQRMAEGLEYARLGQVISLEVEPAQVRAAVQGHAARPRVALIGLTAWSAAQWERLIDELSGEAIHVARLLAGELPPTLHDVCARHGLSLLPSVGEPMSSRCECALGAAGAMCKHAIAAAFLLAERLTTEPLEAFVLRGMTAPRVMDRIRSARTVQVRGAATAHGDALPAALDVTAPPLEQCLESFWRSGPELKDLEQAPPPQHVSHALLRRLGPSPLGGKFPLVGLLASVYDEVSAAAVRLRDRAERIDDGNGGSPEAPSDGADGAPSP